MKLQEIIQYILDMGAPVFVGLIIFFVGITYMHQIRCASQKDVLA